jgi:hypothetical protein
MFFDNFIHDYVITLLLFEFPKEKPRENSVISMLNGESLRIYESHKWKSTLYIVKQN